MVTKFIFLSLVIILVISLFSCSSYQIIDQEKSDNYYFNFSKTEVHYIPMGNSFELGNDKLEAVHIKTVKVLASNYLKDTSHVYFKSILIKNADVNSFEILCTNNRSFAKDKNTIYFESHSFENIDVASFQFVGGVCGSTLKDKTHVYSTYTVDPYSAGNLVIAPIEHAHPATYQFLSDVYGKDDSVAYYKGKPILQADATTFTVIKEYAKDKHAVYFDGLQVKGLDPSTFVLIDGGGYMKDKNGIYYGLNVIEGKDGHPLYYSAKLIVGADPETFTMIKGDKIDYAKDKTRSYWGGIVQ